MAHNTIAGQQDLGFPHVFIPGKADRPVLLLLHGTGGDENDLVGLGQSLDSDAAILSVRGKILENGMPRFFKRFAEGVFDLADLHFRTDELATFIAVAATAYGLNGRPIVALGLSNGANIAASLLLQRPETVRAAMLLRAMVPFEQDPLPDLTGKKILLLSGLMDQIIPVENAKTLAGIFEKAHATVTFKLKPTGHGLVQSDLVDLQDWFSEQDFLPE